MSNANPSAFLLSFLLLCLLAFGKVGLHQVAAGELQAWEKRQKRLESESIALFRAILEKREKDNEDKPATCELGAEWLDYAVPRGIAETYFGLTVPANLSPSSRPSQPAAILDPKGAMREAFCSEKEAKEKLQPTLDKLKKGELKDEKQSSRTLPGFRTYRLEYSAPIFGRRYSRAVVIGSGRTSLWWLKADGKVYNDFDEGIWASIYVKRRGRWHLLRNESIAAASGGAPPQ